MRKGYLRKKMAAIMMAASLAVTGVAGIPVSADEVSDESVVAEDVSETGADEIAPEEISEDEAAPEADGTAEEDIAEAEDDAAAEEIIVREEEEALYEAAPDADAPADSEAETDEDYGIEDAEPVYEAVEGDSEWLNSYRIDSQDDVNHIVYLRWLKTPATEVTVPATAQIGGTTYKVALSPTGGGPGFFAASSVIGNIKIQNKPRTVSFEAGVIFPADCTGLFKGCTSITSLDISGIDTSSVTNMNSMFLNCSALGTITVGNNFKTANVTDMSSMFSGCGALLSFPVSGFNTAKVTNMSNMFNNCYRVTRLNLTGFDTSKVTSMEGMFQNCTLLETMDLSTWNTKNVTSMKNMFSRCNRLRSGIHISSWNTENVKDMSGMFTGCPVAFEDISGWNVAKVEDMTAMFKDTGVETKSLSGWKTSSLKKANEMFGSCSSLKTVNMKNFDLSHLTSASELNLFSGCTSLTTITSPKKTATVGSISLPATFVNPKLSVRVKGTLTDVQYEFSTLPSGSIVLTKGTSGKAWPFSDVVANPENWKYTGIVYCNENEIIMGDKENGEYKIPRTFRPDAPITRRDFSVILYRLAGSPSVAGLTHPFTDVPAGKYYSDAITWAYNSEIVKGTSATTFTPDKNITRVQIAIMLKRYETKYSRGKGYESLSASLDGYTDSSSLSQENREALSWAVGMGVVSGIETKENGVVVSTRLGAKETATRAQCAKMIMGFIEK